MSRFDYVRYDTLSAEKQSAFKTAFAELAEDVERLLPNGRAKACVFTKLEEAYMWVGKAIRDEQLAERGALLDELKSDV